MKNETLELSRRYLAALRTHLALIIEPVAGDSMAVRAEILFGPGDAA
jgi:hypothetical protein